MKRKGAAVLLFMVTTAAFAHMFTTLQEGVYHAANAKQAGLNVGGWHSLAPVASKDSPLLGANIPVSVDAFGALGDGVTNDAAALTAAMASIGEKGGIVELSCSRNYFIGSSITIPDNVSVFHCKDHYGWGINGNGVPGGASLNVSHVSLASTASITMRSNSSYSGAVFRAGQSYPASSISSYAGTAFVSGSGIIQDVNIDALVVGFATCYDGTNRVDRLRLDMECDGNPPPNTGTVILGGSADTSRIKIRMWPWGTFAVSGAPILRRGIGLQVLASLHDDTRLDVLDFGHDIGVQTEGFGNMHWTRVWTDNNASYGLFNKGGYGGNSRFDSIHLATTKGARFEINGSIVSIGSLICEASKVADSECLEAVRPAGSATPLISIGALSAAHLVNFAINIDTNVRVMIGSAKFEDVHGGVGPYIVGSAGWTSDQVQFGASPVTDLPPGSSLYGGHPQGFVRIASDATLKLPVSYDHYTITGAATVTQMIGSWNDRRVMLTCDPAATATIVASSNIALQAGNTFTCRPGATIAFWFEQASSKKWHEMWRD